MVHTTRPKFGSRACSCAPGRHARDRCAADRERRGAVSRGEIKRLCCDRTFFSLDDDVLAAGASWKGLIGCLRALALECSCR